MSGYRAFISYQMKLREFFLGTAEEIQAHRKVKQLRSHSKPLNERSQHKLDKARGSSRRRFFRLFGTTLITASAAYGFSVYDS